MLEESNVQKPSTPQNRQKSEAWEVRSKGEVTVNTLTEMPFESALAP
jgi:hypothetical protein